MRLREAHTVRAVLGTGVTTKLVLRIYRDLGTLGYRQLVGYLKNHLVIGSEKC